MLKEQFEAAVLPKLRDEAEVPLVVPYCTVGYRSGLYAKERLKAILNC